jgi:hypothetical protein
LLTGRVFEANIYFPAAHTLAYSDHLLLQALFLWPVYAATGDLVLCYNVLLLVSLMGSALAMHLLARTLVGSERAAYVAGLIFGFAPYHFTHLTHIQLQALYFLPLSFLFLHRLWIAGRLRDAVALGFVVGLQMLSSIYYGLIGAIGLVVAMGTHALLTRRLSDWLMLKRGLLAAAIAIAVSFLWTIPYLRVQTEAAAGRNLFEASHGSAVLASYVQAPVTNLLYGRSGWLQHAPDGRLPRKEGPEQALFPGFGAMLLALIGTIAAPKALRHVAIVFATTALVGVVLSLGPDGIRPLYSALHQTLFGMAAIRAPARFSVLALCGIAILAAVGVQALELRLPRGKRLTWAALLTVIALEYVNSAEYPPAPTLTSNAGRWLRDQPGHGAVICLPMGLFTGNTACMLQSIEHGRPIVNGYSGLRPPFFEAVVDVASRIPAPDSLLALHGLGVEYIVSGGPLPVERAERRVLVERAAFGDQRVYQIAWSAEAEEALTSATEIAPPEPGVPGFAVGERATYRVLWAGGPMRLPAGEASIAVVPPESRERYHFVVSAKTAPWVSRFYEADATIASTADVRLLPLTYREAIIDGKRRIDRQLTFDADRREVRIASGGTSITLPTGAGARDPLSALFYVRTLPFADGSRFTLPLSDAGRRLRLDVIVQGRESIDVNGQTWSAWKLVPVLGERIERPDRLTVSAWVSADPRHIPLVVEVGAPFGSVRVELASYRQQ